MTYEVVGIEKNIPWNMDGRSGVTNRLYVVDDEARDFTKRNGSIFSGRSTSFIKIPKDVDPDLFKVGDHVQVLYNRFGNVEYIEVV